MKTQYLHTAKYGNPGGHHTMKPMFKKVDNHIYKSEYHPDVIADSNEAHKAVYHVKGNKVYASAAHPDGPSPHALFTITDGGTIHTTIDHPEHQSGQAVFIMDKKPDADFIKKTIAAEAPPPPPPPPPPAPPAKQ
jgi:hypothetical protein